MRIRTALILASGIAPEMSAPVKRHLACGMISFTLLAVVGCSDGGPVRASIQGTITWQGEPIEDGKISFIPQNGGPEAIAKIVDGKYQLPKSEGPSLGINRIAILGLRNLGPQEAGPPHPPGTLIEATQQFIPSEYNNSSQLTAEIQDGENTHDIALPKS